jgi:superfamily II DNA or RNA helicase
VTSETYEQFLVRKQRMDRPSGFEAVNVNPILFPFQRAIVEWACRRGRAAIFADCGLGKTGMQLEWADQVCGQTGGKVLILAPLAVAAQTAREASKFQIGGVAVVRSQSECEPYRICIANYEMLQHFDCDSFAGVVLDESSILKNFTGSMRNAIIESFRSTQYKLACTATPAPNDHMELGNHAEFLGAMSRVEMLSMFFCHDGGDTSQWRLKGHARNQFWKWVCQWAVMMRRPSDIGFDDAGYDMPPIAYTDHVIQTATASAGLLFDVGKMTIQERRMARVGSLRGRVKKAADLCNGSDEQFLVWCDLNDEGDALTEAIDGAIQVTGSQESEVKERALLDFAEGKIRVLVTKPKIAGFGMNFQACRNVVFVGLSDSYEAMYQAVRRCWRFGQKRQVHVHIISSTAEGAVVDNVKRKEKDAEIMAAAMVANMTDITKKELRGTSRTMNEYKQQKVSEGPWTMHLGDCVEVAKQIESESVGFTVFSPPFASLYTYSASDRDMGNCADGDEFAEHFRFLVSELYRVTMPGRLLSFHCMNIPTSKTKDGFIGIRDFRGELIRIFSDAGWIYHSEVCIWKDPVTQMQRTKALGLLHKQIKKDSCMSRQGMADYLVTMRKPGANPEPVANTNESFPVGLWQQYASPVWMDINPSETLQGASAREDEDERHICPLQLEVIRRALKLWSKPGDLVLSPFGGIGSEGYEAVKAGRKFVGIELKESYWKQACANLRIAAQASRQATLFDMGDREESES